MTFTRKITLAIMTASMVGGILAITNRYDSISFVKGENDLYTLSLNTSNKVTSSGEKIMTTDEGGQVTFTYSNVASSTSGHVTLNNSGTFKNKDIIHSITAFTPTFTGSLQARTSYDAETWSEYFDLVSTTEYELGSNPYYVEFKAINASVLVNSISYKYTCLVNEDISTDGGEYIKVTNAADLKVGSTVIFTNGTATVAMSTTQNSNNRGETSVTASGDKTKLTNVSSSVAEFLLGEGLLNNTYSFKDSKGYIYAASNTKKYLKTENTLTEDSSFSISFDSNGYAIVTSEGGYTHNVIRYNSNNSGGHLFSCYLEDSCDPICLYQKQSGASAPLDEIGFLAVDANANTYKTSDAWSTASSFSVKALYSDGTEELLTTGYSYQIKNASGTVIDHTQPFTYAGTYTLTVSYKNYIPQNINLLVSGSTFDPIVDVAIDDVDGTFTTSSKFSTYLSSNEWGCIVERASGDLGQYTYSEFTSNDLELILINPSGITHDIDTVFGTEGTWIVRVRYVLNSSVYDETTFEVNIVPVTTITLDHSSATIEIGDTMQLEVSSIGPYDATHKEYAWSSTNSSIASVNTNGLVTGIAKGTCQIKATATDGSAVFGKCDITVNESSGVTYEFTSMDWKATPSDWTNGKSGNSFNNGGVQVSTGANGANATSPKSFANISKITIGYCTNASNGAGKIKVSVGSTDIADLSVSKNGGTNVRYLQYTPSTPITGYVTITVTCTKNSIYVCSCEIKCGAPVYPTDITLSSSKTNISVGEITNIDVGFTPTDTTIKNLSWSSSNSSVATVSNGVVTGVSAGNATITCVADGEGTTKITKTINITVSNIAVTGVSLSPTSIDIAVGSTRNLTATVSPNNATNKSVTYSSSNPSKATVSSSGVVTGVAIGNATITVTTVDGNKTATCSVTVTAAPVVNKTHIGQTYQDYRDHSYYDCDATPLTGTPKLLIIPIWFSDSTNYITAAKKESVRQDIGTAYLGTNSETGWRSVKTYYEELSNGVVSLDGTVADWYDTGVSSTTVDADDTNNLVTSATNWYFSNNPTDSRTNYDADGNGYLDGVILIYGAPDYQEKSGNENLWAYCYWLQNRNKNVSNPNPNVFFWASYDFMYGSNASSRTGKSYGNGETAHCTIDAHTFIHEMGHVFGIDDYYDYSSHNYSPAGGFSMQDYNVGSHDPYSVMAWGWADPFIPTSSVTIDLHPFQSTKELILLTPQWNSYNSPFDEYLLLELYTPTGLNEFDSVNQYGGYPQGPTTTGIRLWHVDSRLTYVSGGNLYSPITDATHSNVLLATSNSYDTNQGYGSPLASSTSSDYYFFNLLQLIRNDSSMSHITDKKLSSSDLFGNGSSFNMETFSAQFYKDGKLNKNIALGWSFSVTITGSGNDAVARVTCTKA